MNWEDFKHRVSEAYKFLVHGSNARTQELSKNLVKAVDEYEKLLVESGRLIAEQKAGTANLTHNHEIEVESLKESINFIIEKSTRIDWDHLTPVFGPDTYEVRIRFNPYEMGLGCGFRPAMDLVAERIAWEVQREISSCRFIQKADMSKNRNNWLH